MAPCGIFFPPLCHDFEVRTIHLSNTIVLTRDRKWKHWRRVGNACQICMLGNRRLCVCVCIWQTVVCNEGSFVCSQECLEIIFGFRLRIIFLMIREGTVPLKFLTTQKSKPYSVCKNLLMLQENSSDVICQIFCSGKPPFSVSACFGILLADSYIILTWLHIKSQSSPTLISKQMKGGLWDKLLQAAAHSDLTVTLRQGKVQFCLPPL